MSKQGCVSLHIIPLLICSLPRETVLGEREKKGNKSQQRLNMLVQTSRQVTEANVKELKASCPFSTFTVKSVFIKLLNALLSRFFAED